MDFQLNPNAAEFVPTAVSPTLLDRRNIADFPISGSPLKQTALVMDDILVPTQREFEEEVSHRPREIDEKDYTNGDHDNLQGLDVSEISSTRAELGDESIARIMATTQQWSAKMRDDGGVGSELEEYDIATDPMAMSFAPDDFEVAFERSVDLNAVHDLSGADVEGDENECCVPNNNTPPRSPEPYANDDRTHTPFMEKSNDVLHASSTPYTDGTSADLMTNEVSTLAKEQQQTSSIQQELGVSPLTDDFTSEHETHEPEPTASQIDNGQLTKKQVEEVSESAQSAVSDLLETPNPAESYAKESSLSSMSPMQDTLECASPQPVEEETVIPSMEAAELSPAATAPVTSSLQADVSESRLSEQYDLDPFASDYVSSTNNAPDPQKPLDSEVPIAMQNTENLISAEALSTEAVAAAMDPRDLWERVVMGESEWESNACTRELSLENIETQTNLTAQQETDNKPNIEVEETTKLLEYFSQSNELCEIKAEDMKIATDFSATYENVNATIDSLIVNSSTKPVESSYHEPMFETSEAPTLETSEAPILETSEAPTLTNVDMNLLASFPAQEQIENSSAELVDLNCSESMFKADEAAAVTNVDVNLPADFSTQEQQIEKSSAELVDLDFSESMFKGYEAVLTNVDVTSQNNTAVPDPLASVEEQTQDEKIQSLLLDNTPTEALVSSNVPEHEEEKKEPVKVAPTSNETLEEKASTESVSTDKTETVELPADKPKEEVVVAESMTAVTPATATAAAAAAVATAVGVVASSAKAKTSTSAKRPTKTTTTTTTTKTIASTTKAALAKSTPTSPSKVAVSTTTARTTSATSAQSAATKKPAAARPKQLDGPAKAAVSNTTTKSSIAAKTATAAKAATTSATKSTASSRVSAVAMRPRTINTASVTSPKPSTTSGLSDKKSTAANGDAKQLASNKPTAAKSTTSKSTTSSSGTKATTLVKSSSTTTRTSVSAVTSKPRPTSASLAVKASTNSSPKPATTSGLNSSMSRPKTAPASSSVTKTRENTAKASTMKSPMIDKQIKETANKRISLGRGTGASSTTTPKTGRASTPATTAAKSRVTSAKPTNTTTANSPTKKATSKVVASKVSTSAKTTPSNKAKALPNGVPDNTVVTTDNVITTMMNDKLVDDDVPRKDASPVNVPTDNQLIVTAD